MLTFITQFIFNYLQVTLYLKIPYIIINKLNYQPEVLNIGFFVSSICSILVYTVLIIKKITTNSSFFIAILAALSGIILQTFCVFTSTDNPVSVNYILIGLIFIGISIYCLVADVYLVCIIANLVVSDIQSTTESIRAQIGYSASILAGLTIKLTSKYEAEFLLLNSFAFTIIIICMLCRYRTLVDPKPI